MRPTWLPRAARPPLPDVPPLIAEPPVPARSGRLHFRCPTPEEKEDGVPFPRTGAGEGDSPIFVATALRVVPAHKNRDSPPRKAAETHVKRLPAILIVLVADSTARGLAVVFPRPHKPRIPPWFA